MGRRKHVVCKYCGKSFCPDKFNHQKHASCRSPACLRAAGRERKRRERANLKEDKEADRQHKLQEAARASECRMQIKEKCEAAPDALSSLMASPDGLGNVMLGLISQIGDFSARDEVAETAGVLARRGSRLSHQKIHVFRAPG